MSSDESFLPGRRPSPDVERSLVRLAEQRMLAPARRAGDELRLVGATVLPQRQTIARTNWGTWLFVDHAEDPTAKQYGGLLPIPAEQLDRLIELDRHGVRPQHVWIGHQLPRGYLENEPLPRLVPTPRRLREKDTRLKLWLAEVTNLAKGAAAALATAGAGLDPIIFGGVKHPELPFVQWCVLAQWEWE